MTKADKVENKEAFKIISWNSYLKMWFYRVALKVFIDLVMGFLLVFMLIIIGYFIGIITYFPEIKMLSFIFKKASFALAYCYLAAILVSAFVRIYFIVRSDLIALSKLNTSSRVSLEKNTVIKEEVK